MKMFVDNQKTKGLRRAPNSPSPSSSSDGQDSRKAILREAAVMKALSHPHLVRLVEIVEETSPPYCLFVVMEYAGLGPIMQLKKGTDPPLFYTEHTPSGTFGEAQASHLFGEILSGMAYLHLNKIAHRDLKPDNIMLSACSHTSSKIEVKIVDFGVSRAFSEDSGGSGMVCDTQGTWPFWAPEMCDEEKATEKYSAYAADVWAAGVILWVIQFSTLPFFGSSPDEIFHCITGDLPSPPGRRSPEVMTLLTDILTKDPNKRPTFLDCQKYEW
eukprot:CAMPEP_0182421660 /NCGR_PEP_ID=MMETSP1167-20130531/7101_1 /TAXON_ID=2988 /ORGANISM="Mallomonas Sp, Strain CCMP3275" /LENGTH=270 /DNA_ID=CAMNT_0024599003 /DNA_START=254 /DNA_END=1063 /DNA_ORIENTATION=-